MAWSFPQLRLSMRLTLAVTLGLMGALAFVLAITTGEIYRTLALENQRDVLAELADVSATEQLRELEERGYALGLALQANVRFRTASAKNDFRVLTHELQSLLEQHQHASEILQPTRLEAHDGHLNLLASANSKFAKSQPEPSCTSLIEGARGHLSTTHPQVLSSLCHAGEEPRVALLVPVESLAPVSYLYLVVNPVPAFVRIEHRLGFALRLRSPRGERLYASKDWPPPDAMHDTLVGEVALRTPPGEPVVRLALLRDIGELSKRLHQTRYIVMSLAFASTVLVMLLALVVLEKTALRPLGALAEQLRRFGRERVLQVDKLPHSNITEIRELTRDFQQMTEELGRLYGDLQHMAFTDPLTNLPNRARFRDSLAESTRRHARKQTPFALLLMDLDRFKSVNDSFGHQVGDLLLQEVSARLKSVLRESDTITRLVDDTASGYEEKMVARLGGDEFAAILPGVATEDTAAGIARKLLTVIQVPFLIQDHRLSLGMSIGIALYPTHGNDIDELMRRADSAMYVAKSNQAGFAFAESMRQGELL